MGTGDFGPALNWASVLGEGGDCAPFSHAGAVAWISVLLRALGSLVAVEVSDRAGLRPPGCVRRAASEVRGEMM